MTYNEIAVALAVAIPVAGIATELLLRKLLLRGYGLIAGDAAAVVTALDGELDRDSGDLLIRGSMSSLAVVVRFSLSDQRPGLNIQVPVAGNISLFCVPKEHEGEGGRVALPPPDPTFGEHFCLSTNHPGEARMLFAISSTHPEIQKLCRTSGSFLALEEQRLELSELLIPEENVSQYVLDCIRAMIAIAGFARQVPGAEPEPKIQFPRRWHWFRAAYICGPVLLLSSILLLAKLQRPLDVPKPPPVPSGIADEAASQIPDIQHWRVAQASDFDADAVAWLQQQGQEAKGTIRGAFAGREDSAYVLKHIPASPGDPTRLVVLLKGQVRFDANLPEIAIAARIPKDRIASISWRGRGPAGQPDGDGIMVIQRYKDASSALVLFPSGVQLLTGVPKDFHAVSLQ